MTGEHVSSRILLFDALAENNDKQKRNKKKMNNSPGISPPICSGCEENYTAIYCTVCKTSMCKECSNVNHKSAIKKNHERVDWAPYLDASTFTCPTHNDLLDLVCFQCNKEMICIKCYHFGAHKGHKAELIQDVIGKEKEAVTQKIIYVNDEVAKAAATSKTVCERMMKIRCNDNNNNNALDAITEAQENIKKQFTIWKKELDDLENQLIKRVEEIGNEKIASLDQQAKELKSFMDAAINAKTETMTTLENRNEKL